MQWTDEENYMFRLSSFRDILLEHFQSNPEAVYPPQFHADVVGWLQGRLEDLSISRPKSRLSWGIEVPDDPQHTIYVWFDALTAYLSATGFPYNDPATAVNKDLWPPNLQVIGKDILRCVLLSEHYAVTQAICQIPRHLLPCDAEGIRLASTYTASHPFALDR